MPRRAPKPEPFWRDLIARWKSSGQSVAAYCATHSVRPTSFYAWRQRLAAHAAEPGGPPAPPPQFALVRVVPNLTIEILLPSGLVVRAPVGADPAAVARLVAALGGGPC
jgi:transposase-like protein